MLYPTISDWWNSHTQTRAVADYNHAVADLDDGKAEEMLTRAREYNAALARLSSPIAHPEAVAGYDEILDVTGTGIMGYITVPSVQIELPVYHGTSEGVLNIAAGHLKGTSLPVGGPGTHAVISAHRGLPSARLFTDIDKLVVGDVFTLTVLGEIYTYEVEKILIILPDEVDKVAIVPAQDKVTLMTCTPYGINTHRLLVRAHRIDTVYARSVQVSADAVQLDPVLVVPVISAPLVIGLIVFWMRSGKRGKRKFSPDDVSSV